MEETFKLWNIWKFINFVEIGRNMQYESLALGLDAPAQTPPQETDWEALQDSYFKQNKIGHNKK